MIQDRHLNDALSWPEGRRMAVMLSFDLQGGEDVRPDRNGRINHEEWTQAEYGPQTGIWRILRILEETGVKATFLTCGGIAERYPEQVKAIVQNGHEVAGHGYHHEVARDLTLEQEREVIQKTTAMIEKRAGKRPLGWRSCTQSPNSLELLMEHGYLWNSNSFSFDLPFLWEQNGRTLVELPRQPFGDGRAYGHNDSGDPSHALVIWKGMFDEFYEESKFGPTFCPFQFHPFISSRPGRARALKEIIQYMRKHEGVWFARGSEVAELTLKLAGSVTKKPVLKEAVGS
ncbi:MAG: polysaccharide deacetylase family protein [Alphaproteobacteria bacterium]